MHMLNSKKKKILISVLLAGFIFIIIGASNSDTYRSIARSQRIINEVYKHLIVNYADELDTDEFTKISINNMLSDLDPYTVYLESNERDNLDMLTLGKYGGVGIQLGKRDDHLTVISPMEDSPAKHAGILSGDIISKIDDEIVKDLSLNDAAKLIRGQKGTTVVLTIVRLGEEDPIEFYLTRTDIMVQDVAFAEMIDDDTGYIVLTRFSKNAPREMETALRSLINQDMNNLILDLRNNPGGLLAAAIDVLELIIPKGEKLLWTKGRNKESNREFISRKNPLLDYKVKIAVLINEGSASASEIIAGAVQDLDRGVIVGTPSFGKGLVQSVYGLDSSGKRSLKVTTAKYYVPSGRLIQKPGYINDKLVIRDEKEDSVFVTVGGRKVKGEGGITPDYEVVMPKSTPLLLECWRKGLFFSFSQEWQHKYDSYEDALIDLDLMADFKVFIDAHEVDVTTEGEKQFQEARTKIVALDSNNIDLTHAFDFVEMFIIDREAKLFEKEKDDLRRRLLLELVGIINGTEFRVAESIKDDPVVIKAKEILQDPVAYSGLFQPKNNDKSF